MCSKHKVLVYVCVRARMCGRGTRRRAFCASKKGRTVMLLDRLIVDRRRVGMLGMSRGAHVPNLDGVT
jgi:hypothetical protein